MIPQSFGRCKICHRQRPSALLIRGLEPRAPARTALICNPVVYGLACSLKFGASHPGWSFAPPDSDGSGIPTVSSGRVH